MGEDRPTTRKRAEELAATLPPLLVSAEQVATTVYQGVHGRRRVGQGETFWQFRRYEWGDSAQMIDWRQSAKSQPLFVRENEWEAAQSVWLWRDTSPSMRFRSASLLSQKSERADLLLIALLSLLVRGGEHVALIGADFGPSGGRVTFNRLTEIVMRSGPPGPSLPPVAPLPRHARLVLIGDFLSPLDEIDEVVRGYATRGTAGHLLQILDPAEETLPFRGRNRSEGVEDDGTVVIDRTEDVRSAYLDRMTAQQRGLESIARAAGWSFATHLTDRPPQTALLALYAALAGLPRA